MTTEISPSPLFDIKPKFVIANGLQFAYIEQGDGPLVLLLHGFPDTPYTWDRTMIELARVGYRVVAPFMRGYYPTELAGPYDTDMLGRDALALVESLGERSGIIVGHDWGASAGYAAAALGPDRIRLLVTLSIPHPKAIKPTPATLWHLRHFFTLGRKSTNAKIRAGNFVYIDELIARCSPTWNVPTSETVRVKEVFAHPGCLEAACAYYTAPGSTPPPSSKLPITVPTVAFAGKHDHIFPARSFEQAGPAFKNYYEVVQVPGGHFMHREHPVEFIAALLRVLREYERRNPL